MNKSKIPTTAQALYRELLEAFATGDVATIQKVATPVFADRYIRAIEKRRPNEKMSFEIEFNKAWWYPRLMSYMVTNVNPADPLLMGEQAVVAISSIQRLDRGDGLKEQKMLEYLVLRREFRKDTYLPVREWRIWQMTKPTTLESWEKAEEAFNQRLLEQVGSEVGWKKGAEAKKANA
jgi:protein MBA1